MISQSTSINYSLVIPCYNESDNLSELVKRCRVLLNMRPDVEVLLIDNGSTDSTQETLEFLLKDLDQINLKTLHIRENQGYGFGIISGLKKCRGSVIGWTHADLQTDPCDFVDAIAVFEGLECKSEVLVKGNRVGRPFKDVFFTLGMSIVEWLLLGVRMWDINAQPTVFSKDFFLSLEGMPYDFSLDLFVYNRAIANGMVIKRFPVTFGLRLKGEGHNETLLSKLKYSYKIIRYSIELRKRLKSFR